MQQDITIIICCYNGAERLPKVLDKIYAQQDLEKYIYEIIVVDNHSVDMTKKVVNNYLTSVNVPLCYIYEEIPGLSNARKRGISVCKTSWIAFLDDDNLIEEDWVQRVVTYIQKNPRVGVFNGAVIPHISFNMSTEEIEKLKASIKVLACTHYNMEELQKNPNTPFRNPIGAGMVVLANPLKELIEKGWLNSSGRTKDKLTSGEDGEMAFYVKSKGYKFGFCPEAILYHEIDRKRLEDDYLYRIWYEIGKGVAIVAKKQRAKRVKILVYKGLLIFRGKLYELENTYKGKYYKKYIEGFMNEI